MLRERRGIIGLAIGQARDAGVGAGAGQEFGQYVDLARERGADRPRENRRGALAIARKADFRAAPGDRRDERLARHRSEEHTSELPSLMRISYAVFCLKKTKQTNKLE